ncbi:putative membrane protein [Escherichia coli 2-210-07_S3_C3]|nr:putative membrane protein [Escherichia coli 2-210-07_S3_C3]KDX17673.1 putative membrane protein [Escherichia coli 2-210-07_S3_C3]
MFITSFAALFKDIALLARLLNSLVASLLLFIAFKSLIN